MYKTGSNHSSRAMGSLGRDYIARIPIDLNCSPPSSKATIHPSSSSPQYNTADVLSRRTPYVLTNGASVVRCRIDSDSNNNNAPCVIGLNEDHQPPEAYDVMTPYETMTSAAADDVSGRSWSTSSESRETGSILKKKPEFSSSSSSSSTLNNSDRLMKGGGRRTPQERRRVRFTNNVSLYRFDSDGVDSAYSSSECERLYAPINSTAARRSVTAPNKYTSTTVSIPGGGSMSNINIYSIDDDTSYNSSARSVVGRRIQDAKQRPLSPSGFKQEIRGHHVLHGTPNGYMYVRNNSDKTRSMPSVHWLGGRSSPTLSSQKQGPVLSGSLGALKTTSYTLVTDPVTQEKKLVITAKLSGIFHSNDITIKANKNGNKIRIVSSRLHQGPSVANASPYHHLLNEQLLLPVQVYPYKLTARLDANGTLLIEAPCAVV